MRHLQRLDRESQSVCNCFWLAIPVTGIARQAAMRSNTMLSFFILVNIAIPPLPSQLYADADSAVAAIVVECCDVVSAGFRKIHDLRHDCALATDKSAIEHPVDFGVSAANFEPGFGSFFAGRTA